MNTAGLTAYVSFHKVSLCFYSLAPKHARARARACVRACVCVAGAGGVLLVQVLSCSCSQVSNAPVISSFDLNFMWWITFFTAPNRWKSEGARLKLYSVDGVTLSNHSIWCLPESSNLLWLGTAMLKQVFCRILVRSKPSETLPLVLPASWCSQGCGVGVVESESEGIFGGVGVGRNF
jgi:hypothetical protein